MATHIERAQTPCPVCLADAGVTLSRRSRDGTPLHTILCQGCGIARTDPLPKAGELEAFYREEYWLTYKGVLTPRRKHVLRAARLARQRLSELSPFVLERTGLLDIGAGGGEFVYLARAAGFDARGVEPNAGYAGYAREVLKLPVEAGTWQTVALPKGTFAAVTMFHVLEHLPDPLACLRTIAQWLQPGGVLFVEVPNLLSPVGNPARRFHQAHVVHFTPETLHALAVRAGFHVLRADAPGDGANVRLLARKPESADGGAASEAVRSEPAFDAILRAERNRGLSPALRPAGWLRMAKRLVGMAEEAVYARMLGDRTAILRHYARAVSAEFP